MIRRSVLAALLAAPAIALAQAGAEDPLACLGWLKDLAGSCWRGTDAAGKSTGRQCCEIQSGRFPQPRVEGGGGKELLAVDYRRVPR